MGNEINGYMKMKICSLLVFGLMEKQHYSLVEVIAVAGAQSVEQILHLIYDMFSVASPLWYLLQGRKIDQAPQNLEHSYAAHHDYLQLCLLHLDQVS